MTLVVKHRFTSLVADNGDPNEVGPDEWNDSHTLTGFIPVTLGGTGSSTTASAQQALALEPGVDVVGLSAGGTAGFAAGVRVSATLSVGSLVVGGTSTLSGAVRALTSLDVSATLSAAIAILSGVRWPTTIGNAGEVPQLESASGTLTFTALAGSGDMVQATYDPAGVSEQLVGLTATQTLTNKTLNSFTNYIIADSTHIQVFNNSGGTLTKGTPVYISGFNVGQSIVEVSAADADNAAAMPAIGLVMDDITNATAGSVLQSGTLDSFDTSAYSVGDALYVDTTAGQLTATKPTAGDTQIQKMALVLRSNVANGVLEVVGAGRSNDIPNSAAPQSSWSFASDIRVAGTTSLSGAVRAVTTLDVSATASLGALQVAGTTTLSGAARAMTSFDVSATLSAGQAILSGARWPTAVGGLGTIPQVIGASGTMTFTAIAGSGDVTAAANLTDNAVVRGDGGVKGVQTSGVILGDSNTFTGIAALTIDGSATISGPARFSTTLDVSATVSAAHARFANALPVNQGGTGSSTTASAQDALRVRAQGIETINIPADAMYATTSNGATYGTTAIGAVQISYWAFAVGANSNVQFKVDFPNSFNLGAPTAIFKYTHLTATQSSTVAWNIQAVAIGDNQSLSTAFGTAIGTSHISSATANKKHIITASASVSIAGTVADGDTTYFQVTRDVAAGALQNDARLLAVILKYTTDAKDDT